VCFDPKVQYFSLFRNIHPKVVDNYLYGEPSYKNKMLGTFQTLGEAAAILA
jgi:hypothetical protein